jgi:hypothetical protein
MRRTRAKVLFPAIVLLQEEDIGDRFVLQGPRLNVGTGSMYKMHG